MMTKSLGIAAICAVVCITAALLIVPPVIDLLSDDFIVYARQQGPFVTLTWDRQADAIVYEVQGRMFDGEWSTIGMMPAAIMKTTLPPGIASFRARAWFEDGPGEWSPPSEFLLFLPPAPEPEYEEPDNSSNEALIFLPWDPDLMEPGEYDDQDDA